MEFTETRFYMAEDWGDRDAAYDAATRRLETWLLEHDEQTTDRSGGRTPSRQSPSFDLRPIRSLPAGSPLRGPGFILRARTGRHARGVVRVTRAGLVPVSA